MSEELEDWNVVANEIKRTKIPRVNWKKFLGVSLAEYCATNWKNEKTTKQTIDEVLIRTGSLEDWQEENLLISVSARYSTLRSNKKVLEKPTTDVKVV